MYKRQGFYMPVQRVRRPNHEFRGFQGQIENGAIRAGDLVTTLPSKEEAHVKSILVGNKEVQKAVQLSLIHIFGNSDFGSTHSDGENHGISFGVSWGSSGCLC